VGREFHKQTSLSTTSIPHSPSLLLIISDSNHRFEALKRMGKKMVMVDPS